MARRGSRRATRRRKGGGRIAWIVAGVLSLLVAGGAWVFVQQARERGEADLRVAEARRAELLATTVPKKEFWDQVERKGVANKAALAVGRELAEIGARIEAQERAAAELAPQRDLARMQREKMEQALSDARAELARAQRERETRESVLEEFRRRMRAPEPSAS